MTVIAEAPIRRPVAEDYMATPVRHEEDAERAARVSLRDQIGRLEQRVGLLAMELWESGRTPLPRHERFGREGARLLTLGELEAVRDELVGHLGRAELALRERSESQARHRARLEVMLADPEAHRYEIVQREQLGEPGCGAYHVLPRLGLLGMLFGWWCVKLSSGCP